MFREMRLKEQALSQDEIEKVLTTAANGTLAVFGGILIVTAIIISSISLKKTTQRSQ